MNLSLNMAQEGVYAWLTLSQLVQLVQLGQNEPLGERLQEEECLESPLMDQTQTEDNRTSMGPQSSPHRYEAWGGWQKEESEGGERYVTEMCIYPFY